MNTQEKELKHCTACNQMTNHSGETCLKHIPDTEKNAYSRGYKQGRFDADMDRLNKTPTPDTEWEKFLPTERELEKVGEHYWGGDYSPSYQELMNLSSSFKEILAPKIKDLRTARDTYWKERVRKEVEGMKRKITFNGSDESGFIQYGQVIDSDCEYNQALDTLLDNLK